MSDLINLYLYYIEMRNTTYYYEEYRMFDQLARNLSAILEGMVNAE